MHLIVNLFLNTNTPGHQDQNILLNTQILIKVEYYQNCQKLILHAYLISEKETFTITPMKKWQIVLLLQIYCFSSEINSSNLHQSQNCLT